MSGSVGALLWMFLVISALVVASEGLSPSEIRNINQRQSEPELSRIVSPGAPKQNINDSEKSSNFNDVTSSLSAARALATYSPEATNGIHQSGLGRVGSGGGVALQRERYIHDWEVEDYVLLSTVDGSLYATDRKTGVKRWDISSNYPAVQITAHRANISHPVRDWIPDDNVVWIVEPVNGGQLYYYSPDSGLKVGFKKQGLPCSVHKTKLTNASFRNSVFLSRESSITHLFLQKVVIKFIMATKRRPHCLLMPALEKFKECLVPMAR